MSITIEELIKFSYEMNEKVNRYKEQIEKTEQEARRLIKKYINYDEIDKKYKYIEAKEIVKKLNGIQYTEETKQFLKSKKEKEYPEILGVHYYPEIKKMTWLDEANRVELDRLIKENNLRNQSKLELFLHNSKTSDFLKENKIIKKEYVLSCSCGDWNCDKEIIPEGKYKLLKKYWEDRDSITDEEYEEINYGYIELPCCHERIEIEDMEGFEMYLEEERYRIIKKADLTLDKI